MRTDDKPSLDVGGVVGAAVFALLGAWVLYESASMSAMGSVFPRTIAIVMIAMSLALIGLSLAGRYKPGLSLESGEAATEGSIPRRLMLIAIMLAWVLLMPVIGFFVTSVIGFLGVLLVANYDGWTARRAIAYAVISIAIVAGFYALMAEVLLIPMPTGLLF